MDSRADVFKGRHFDQVIILLCVRWYISYKLSLRDLVEMMEERSVLPAQGDEEHPGSGQDHRRIKQRIRPMLGFKKFANAVVTISGIELAEEIRKDQFYSGQLGGSATLLQLWNAALAA